MELKPALSYEEQINKLKNDHNLSITYFNYAEDIFKKVNYYRLSGYNIKNDQRYKIVAKNHII